MIARLIFAVLHPVRTHRHFKAVNAPWPEIPTQGDPS